MPLADRGSTPLIIRIFHRVMSTMATVVAVFGVVAIMAALRPAVRAQDLLHVVVCRRRHHGCTVVSFLTSRRGVAI
jgi:hypothetical protein